MPRKLILGAFILFAFVAACTKESSQSQPVAAPDFILQDLNGRTFRLADYRGKVVLVEFWATWCPPCQESIPGVERLYKAYGGKGLEVLAVSVDDGGWDGVQKFVKQAGITYHVLKGTDDVEEKYSVRSIPALYLVNKDGVIARQYLGAGNEESLEQDLRTLL